MADAFHEPTVAVRGAARPRYNWIADAPADADQILATVRVLPAWVGLLVAVGGALILWAAIFIGLRWLLAR